MSSELQVSGSHCGMLSWNMRWLSQLVAQWMSCFSLSSFLPSFLPSLIPEFIYFLTFPLCVPSVHSSFSFSPSVFNPSILLVFFPLFFIHSYLLYFFLWLALCYLFSKSSPFTSFLLLLISANRYTSKISVLGEYYRATTIFTFS